MAPPTYLGVWSTAVWLIALLQVSVHYASSVTQKALLEDDFTHISASEINFYPENERKRGGRFKHRKISQCHKHDLLATIHPVPCSLIPPLSRSKSALSQDGQIHDWNSFLQRKQESPHFLPTAQLTIHADAAHSCRLLCDG